MSKHQTRLESRLPLQASSDGHPNPTRPHHYVCARLSWFSCGCTPQKTLAWDGGWSLRPPLGGVVMRKDSCLSMSRRTCARGAPWTGDGYNVHSDWCCFGHAQIAEWHAFYCADSVYKCTQMEKRVCTCMSIHMVTSMIASSTRKVHSVGSRTLGVL